MSPWSVWWLGMVLSPAWAQDSDAASDPARPERIPEEAVEVPLREGEADEASISDAADAADAPDAEAVPEDEEEADYTVIVVREQDVRAARDALVREMESLSWKTKRKRDGRVVFKGPEPWMGKMTLRPNGVIDFTTPSIAFGGTGGVDTEYQANPRSNMDPQTGSAGVAIGFDGKRKAAAVQSELRAAITDDLEHLRSTIRARGFGRMVEQLPDRLDGVWNDGIGMDGSSLHDPTDKRRDVLSYWSSRTDTPEGRVVMRTIEVWLRQTVMLSDHPVTPQEAADAEAARDDGRTLDIF